MTEICTNCRGDDIFSHRPFAHTKELRFHCGGCGQRIHGYKHGPRGLGKVVMTRNASKAPINAPHPVRYYPNPRGMQRLRIKGRDEPLAEQPSTDIGPAFKVPSKR